MRILILGGDGYLGWPAAMHFSALGHDVKVVDSCAKREWEAEVGGYPLWAVPCLRSRVQSWEKISGKKISTTIGDVAHWPVVEGVFREFEPETIINFAQQPSAPYSMRGPKEAAVSQTGNMIGGLNVLFAMRNICPDSHLVTLGTMGEYGTPNLEIPEGFFEVEYRGRKDNLPFPRQPGSFYHLSKAHTSLNTMMSCRWWGLRATELNQGVVYGFTTPQTQRDPDLRTSFHYDAVFGTALNRFCVQAVIGMPLTVYGKGGQTRGYLNINDTLQCVGLAVDNLPPAGQLRVFNQFTEIFSVMQLAEIIKRAGSELGMRVEVQHIPDPRVEAEEHFYQAVNSGLLDLGMKPRLLSEELVEDMLMHISAAKEIIRQQVIFPTISWRCGEKETSFKI